MIYKIIIEGGWQVPNPHAFTPHLFWLHVAPNRLCSASPMKPKRCECCRGSTPEKRPSPQSPLSNKGETTQTKGKAPNAYCTPKDFAWLRIAELFVLLSIAGFVCLVFGLWLG